MEKREVIAYAITHAPRGQKGGPYEAESGPPGEECDSLRDACRWPTSEPDARECAAMYLEDHLSWQGDARVIRIVRKARPSRLCDACGFLIEAESRRRAPSEASAVEVLREYVEFEWIDHPFRGRRIDDIQASMRRILAASGPDPSEVVRAAMRFVEHCTPALEGSAWFEATREFIDAVDAYRKAGGTP